MTDTGSETPLARKLDLRDGQRVWFSDMPENVQDEIGEYALELIPVRGPDDRPDSAHVFVSWRSELERDLSLLRDTIVRNGQVWVSWPKKAAGVATDLTEDTIREVALPMGFVDTKVCAVDEIWSGLKLVIRKDLR